MVQRVTGFLVVLLLMFSEEIFGQEKSSGHLPLLIQNEGVSPSIESLEQSDFSRFFSRPAGNTFFQKTSPINVVSTSYYTTHMGFFCKQELQLEKKIAVPLSFRIGSLVYVNYMEQKPNSVILLR